MTIYNITELRKAYKKQAVKWHPDKHASKTDAEKQNAEERFKQMAEAYDVLRYVCIFEVLYYCIVVMCNYIKYTTIVLYLLIMCAVLYYDYMISYILNDNKLTSPSPPITCNKVMKRSEQSMIYMARTD